MRCPKCGGEAGAHYAACVFTNMLQRWLGDDYPLFGPAEPGIQMMDVEVFARNAAETATLGLREQMAKMQADLDAAMEAITRPHPSPPAGHEFAEVIEEDRPGIHWPTYVKGIREQYGWSQERLAKEIGCARSLVGFWEQGMYKPGPKNARILHEIKSAAPDGPPPSRRTPAMEGMLKANAAEGSQAADVVKQILAERTEPDPDGWIPARDLLTLARIIDPELTPRLVGLGLSTLGYTEKKQLPVADGSRPMHYRGLKWKDRKTTEAPAPEPPLEEQMAQRRAAEAEAQAALPKPAKQEEKYRYDGPRPGGELYPEFRELIEPLFSVPGWSYAPTNANGGGKPRVITPEGTMYVLPNTPSDWRAVRNARAALRRLGAPL